MRRLGRPRSPARFGVSKGAGVYAALVLSLSLASACGGDENAGPAPQWSSLKAAVFMPSCAFASCHGGDAPEQGLHFGTIALAALVNQPSQQAPGRVLVVPGDPDASYLFEKLAKPMPQVGNQMPPRGAGGALPPQDVNAVRAWIVNGALDN